jgi:hypothetical protein
LSIVTILCSSPKLLWLDLTRFAPIFHFVDWPKGIPAPERKVMKDILWKTPAWLPIYDVSAVWNQKKSIHSFPSPTQRGLVF